MLLSQGRYWRAALARSGETVGLSILRDALPAEHADLRELRIDVPLAKWNSVVRHAASDRKLLGGVLLGFASHEECVSAAVASDRLLFELQNVIRNATTALVEAEVLILVPRDDGEGDG